MAAPPTWAPDVLPGETRGEGLGCTRSGRLMLPGKPLLLEAELRLCCLSFCKKRERGGASEEEQPGVEVTVWPPYWTGHV